MGERGELGVRLGDVGGVDVGEELVLWYCRGKWEEEGTSRRLVEDDWEESSRRRMTPLVVSARGLLFAMMGE